MIKKEKKLIRYTSKDFNSIKESLVEYSKRYYPDVHKDFSEASFGSLMLDTVAYVGDMLSFYLDYQANESFLDTAIEYDNILRLGEQVGYKQSLRANSFGVVTLYILANPDSNNIGPDLDYLPILARGTKFSSNAGQLFTLMDDIDFRDSNNEVVVATSKPTDGTPTSYAIKAYGRVISGIEENESFNINNFVRFLTLSLENPNITEVVSVIDSEGREYFEVDYLSQDTIFRSVINKDRLTREYVPSIIVSTSVPRRFTTTYKDGAVHLKFGYGSESSSKIDNLTHPSNVVLKMHGRDYEKDASFDPSKLISTDKFGIAPSNTTIRVVYRTNTSDTTNVATRGLSDITEPIFVFGSSATNSAKIDFVKGSLEVINESPITGDVALPTVAELKQRVTDVFASQNRAVTADDYEALVYRMPPKFGNIKRAKIIRDHDSFKRNLNLYLLSENADTHLTTSSQVLKNNVKIWLNHYRMINDTIDILDPKIINIHVDFTAVVDYSQDRFEALNVAITEIQNMFREKMDINQPIYITKIYDVLNNLDEIVDVTKVKIKNKSGGIYSDSTLNLKDWTSTDGRILYAPQNVVYELKFPNTDIRGTIR